MAGHLSNNKSPGLFAAIIDAEGVSEIASAGFRKQGSPEPLTINDLVHLGSCTKAMTSTMLATLVADGTFPNGWQTTIAQVFPEIVPTIHEDYASVTLWQLVTHRSGIAANAQDWWVHQDLEIVNRRYTILTENLANAPAGPVSEFLYSNLGYMVAGAMAEKLTSKSWETLMEERVFTPLGMSTAGFGPPGTPNEVDQPWGHKQEGQSTVWIPQQLDNAAALGPAGTVHCSIYDWAKFIELQFANKTPAILDRAKLNELITPTTGNYAAGWGVNDRTWAGPGGVALQHTGSNALWYVNLWIAPALDRAFLAGANSKNDDSFLMSDAIIWSLINHDDVDPDDLDDYAFSLVGGEGSEHNGLFAIDGNGTLRTTEILDYETLEGVAAGEGEAVALEFTNAGVTGRTGPTQNKVNTAYAGTPLEGEVTVNVQGIQEWTVPVTGLYRIAALGASATGTRAGKGARMEGTFELEAGQVLKVLVGQQGQLHSDNDGYSSGGGGGTFVWESDEEPEAAWERIPPGHRQEIIDKNIRIFILPGFEIAHAATSRADLQLRMQGNAFLGAFFGVSSLLADNDIAEERFHEVVRAQYVKKFGRFGDAVVESNMTVMTEGFSRVRRGLFFDE